MKFQLNYIAAVIAAASLLVSCNNDDDNSKIVEGTTGDAELYFDNGIAGNKLVLGNSYTNSNNETLTINRLNYIISNVVLINEDRKAFTYPKESSYFIISQENNKLTVHLEDIPAGNYKQVKFGIGVDQARINQGEAAQQVFWNLAVANNLGTEWADGYRFITYEGTYTDPSAGHDRHGEIPFAIYQRNDTSDNYREVTLNLPTTARVRQGDVPNIHLKTDVNVLLDGDNKILLHDNVDVTETATLSGDNLVKLANNTLKMFVVDHVHNGAGHHE